MKHDSQIQLWKDATLANESISLNDSYDINFKYDNRNHKCPGNRKPYTTEMN